MSPAPLELWGLSPLWITIAGSILLLTVEFSMKEEGRRIAPIMTGTILVLALGAVFRLLNHPAMPGSLFQGSVVMDLYSVTLTGICLLSALLACLFSASYMVREKAVTGEYYALLLLAVSGMQTLVISADFLTLFMGLELMSLSAYVLAGYLRTRERSTEAALKYFLNGVFASAFLLYGIAMIYGVSGSVRFQDIRLFLEHTHTYPLFIGLGVVLILVGLGFKVAAVPFHAWAPDVYEGSAAPVSVLLSTGVKTAGFGILARLFAEVFGLPGGWTAVIPVLAVLTMGLGNLGALTQTSVKRMLAYSSVAQAGYLLVGLSAASFAPADDVERSVAFYLLAYTLMTAGAFGWAAWASGKGETNDQLEDYRGLGLSHPFLGSMMALFLFSLAGMTPTAGFFGKYYLFKLAVDHGMVWLAIVAVLNSFISAFYYLRVVVYLFMKPLEGKGRELGTSFEVSLSFFLCAIGVLMVGFLKFPF